MAEVPLVSSTQGRDLYAVLAGGFHFRVTEYRRGLTLPLHRHEHAKMSTVVTGRYTESYGSRSVDCDLHTLLLKPAGATHADAYRATDTVCLTMDLQPSALESVRAYSALFGAPEDLRFRSPLISRVMGELESPDPVSPLVLEGLALDLVAMVARRKSFRIETPAAFRRACDFLDGHLTTPVSMDDVAAAARVHPSHLTRLFRAHAGCSPGQWLRSRRIDEAKRLLRATALPISSIALSLGFFDQSHFGNVFRRETGVTPAHFRRTHSSA